VLAEETLHVPLAAAGDLAHRRRRRLLRAGGADSQHVRQPRERAEGEEGVGGDGAHDVPERAHRRLPRRRRVEVEQQAASDATARRNRKVSLAGVRVSRQSAACSLEPWSSRLTM
jgi:hypothetical protein